MNTVPSTKSLIAWTWCTALLAGSSTCCTAGWAQGWRREKEGFLPKEKEGFLGVRFCIYVLLECKPLVGVAWGFRQYDVSRSYRLCQDNSSTSSGCDGTQRSTEPPHLCVLLFQGVSHSLSHLNTRAWHSLRGPQVSKISKWSWQIWLLVRGQAGYCRPWQVAASTSVYTTEACLQHLSDHKHINL